MSTENQTIKFAALPSLGEDLAGGRFAGIITATDGTHCAVVLLPGYAEDVTWDAAGEWAKAQGGQLPGKREQSLLFAYCKAHLEPHWHWSRETNEDDASYACGFYFTNGAQLNLLKSYKGHAVAVRLIPVGSEGYSND